MLNKDVMMCVCVCVFKENVCGAADVKITDRKLKAAKEQAVSQ